MNLIAPTLRSNASGRWFVVPAGTTRDPVVLHHTSNPEIGFSSTPEPSTSITVTDLPLPPPAAVISIVSPT